MASTSQPQHYFEALPGQLDLVETIAKAEAEEARQAPTGNGGPPLDEHPGLVVARIGRACYGPLWHGKLAEDIGENHQTVRRWESAECRPNQVKIDRVKAVAAAHIARIQRALEKR